MITKLTELKEADYNPRSISETAIEGLTASIDEYGDLSGVVFNIRTGNLVSGHQRVKDMLSKYGDLEIKDGEIILPTGEQFKIRYVDWDPIKEKSANVTANNPHIQGEFTSGLRLLIEEIKLNAPETLETLKLDMIKIPVLKKSVDREQLEIFPEPEENLLSKEGDIFLINNRHRIMCGDSTEKAHVSELMADKKAIMTFMDPPYNVDYGANKNHPSWKIRAIKNDKQTADDWILFNEALAEVTKEFCGGDVYMWGASTYDGMKARCIFIEKGFHWSATIIWKKNRLVLTPAKFQRMYEPCLYGWFEKSSFVGDRKNTEVWEVDRPMRSELHPTMKPIELCERGISLSSSVGDLVLDLFLGSGSTLIASELLDRVCYGMELDPKYVDVILKRFHNVFHGSDFQCLTRDFNFKELFNEV